MFYRSMNDLNQAIVAWTRTLPRSPDLIVGIPRSGLLVANMIALYMNRAMTDVDGLIRGRYLNAGPRLNRALADGRPLDVLVVDDSLWSGTQMAETRRRIAAARLSHRIRYAVVYIAPGTADRVDFHYEVVPVPRVFEWNLMHHPFLEEGCLDIGVLFGTQSVLERSIAPGALANALSGLAPEFYPDRCVGWLVSDLSTAHRPALEAWLARHEIMYRALVLRGDPMDATAPGAGGAAFMADVYSHTRAWIFIASRAAYAAEIARRAFRPVFCYERHRMFFPGDTADGRPSLRAPLRWLWGLGMAGRSLLATRRSITVRTRNGPAVR